MKLFEIIDLNGGKILGVEKSNSAEQAIDQWRSNNGYRINLAAAELENTYMSNIRSIKDAQDKRDDYLVKVSMQINNIGLAIEHLKYAGDTLAIKRSRELLETERTRLMCLLNC